MVVSESRDLTALLDFGLAIVRDVQSTIKFPGAASNLAGL